MIAPARIFAREEKKIGARSDENEREREAMRRLLTEFGEKLNKDLPLNEYPRPQMRRDSFQNLNGRWEYAIRKKGERATERDGEIVVPFSPECILSGVERILKPDETLHYRRKFEFAKTADRALIHFGAVDYKCAVRVNGKQVGTNTGGYYPFTFDISESVAEGENVIEVDVEDPTDSGAQARGKQSSKRGGIWYTPQSGIWQTVWIEQVCENHIRNLRMTPDVDSGTVRIELEFAGEAVDAEATALDGETPVATATLRGGAGELKLSEFRLWSPEEPNLYGLRIVAGADEIRSYFGMRKFGVGKDSKGISRLMLNGRPYFHNGVLDQGYWSDGLYTAPSDEAMVRDIRTMKDAGFNMIRKHIKIEPARWYYHCDRIGMLVWQDMVSGGGAYKARATMLDPALNMAFGTKRFMKRDGEANYAYFSREDKAGRDEYYADSRRMIDALRNATCIAVWVPFNEGWGQFDSARALELYRALDGTRSVDHASGWHDQGIGDFNSFHIYFTPFLFPKFSEGDDRPIVLSEFGGYSLKVEGHMRDDRFFGYRKYRSEPRFRAALERLYLKRVKPAIKRGLAAATYTELSDVEDECNGLVTFDRRKVKIDVERMRKINGEMKIDD